MTPRRVLGWLLIVCCLALAACGSEEIDEPGSGDGDGSPTSAASPTSEPTTTLPATPTQSATPASIAINDLKVLEWQLVQIGDEGVIDGSVVTLTMIPHTRNLLNGFAECHSYFVGVEWGESSFQISESGPFAGLEQRERVCQHPEGGPEQDAAFFAALADATSYHATDERLTLFGNDGSPRLAFVPRPPVTVDPALTGTTWQLTDLNGDSPLPGTLVTLMFGESFASGNDGCNGYGAQLLTASDGRLVFGNGAEDQALCLTPEGVMEQSDRFGGALFNSVFYQVDGDQLTLTGHDGSPALTFIRQEAAAFDARLAAHRWGLIEANGQPAIPGSLVTLELAKGSISGSDGCNFYGGEMIYADNGLIDVVSPGLTQTAAGCRTDDLLPQAELVTGILHDASWYQIDGDRLTIGDTAGNRLVFGPQADVLLIGSSWSVPMLYTELPGGEIRGDALIEGTEITLTFTED
ncbi:MAG TPA: META domain-containing protein, partial [Thermomicrobiales bacterium]|nr:META domain-containing protein [Thermomicrobiales bacterium]